MYFGSEQDRHFIYVLLAGYGANKGEGSDGVELWVAAAVKGD